MLGKLARWLRIMGYDTSYTSGLNDSELMSLASAEGRIILTRDKELFERATKKGIGSIFIKSLSISSELDELSSFLKEKPEGSRCPLCNTLLQQLNRSEINSIEVPKINPIWLCNKCGKVYWHGSHWKRITETLRVLYNW